MLALYYLDCRECLTNRFDLFNLVFRLRIGRAFCYVGVWMDFQKLKTFQTVATLMNFNRAAEVLHYAQSSVSAQVKALEEEVGVLFFNRVGKQVSLTEAGEKMVKYADRILAMGEEAVADVNGRRELEGTLTLRAPQTVATCYLPRVLAAFQPRFPKVCLDVNSCAFHSLENELRIGTVDVAFLLTESVQAAGLNVELLATEKLRVVAAPGHPLASRERVGFSDLDACPVFLPKADCGYRMPSPAARCATLKAGYGCALPLVPRVKSHPYLSRRKLKKWP